MLYGCGYRAFAGIGPPGVLGRPDPWETGCGDKPTDENENGRLDQSELDVHRSRTTFLQPQVGGTLRFRDSEE